ncbi:iron transporter [Bifidobacterium bombi]|uniref:Fe2+ transport protein n=1 Tax=Bifidobacterium bombi DSM 19703 TaxID=1341695 RepID=A0A086BP81_9BIFI|nr:iron transporter [Bifidobacterium bombi]KFF30745.1 Fe2+ transport protein [Bifidobacterium bombi DSM 19703]
MKHNKLTGALALLTTGVLMFSLAACGDNTGAQGGQAGSSQSQSSKQDTGKKNNNGAKFEEIPIGDDQQIFPLNIGAVYFQPVDMYPQGMGLPAAQSNLHLEADIHALKDNKLGYGTGEFVPNLTVKYKIQDKNDPNNKQEGTFMGMNADDGPHYGANIKLDKAGQYKLTFIIYSPQTNGWTLHVDPDTGVKGRFWTEPIEANFDWDYTVHQW